MQVVLHPFHVCLFATAFEFLATTTWIGFGKRIPSQGLLTHKTWRCNRLRKHLQTLIPLSLLSSLFGIWDLVQIQKGRDVREKGRAVTSRFPFTNYGSLTAGGRNTNGDRLRSDNQRVVGRSPTPLQIVSWREIRWMSIVGSFILISFPKNPIRLSSPLIPFGTEIGEEDENGIREKRRNPRVPLILLDKI